VVGRLRSEMRSVSFSRDLLPLVLMGGFAGFKGSGSGTRTLVSPSRRLRCESIARAAPLTAVKRRDAYPVVAKVNEKVKLAQLADRKAENLMSDVSSNAFLEKSTAIFRPKCAIAGGVCWMQ